MPARLGLIEAIHDLLTAIVITASCIKLIIQFDEIYIQISEKRNFFESVQRHLSFALLAENLSRSGNLGARDGA